MELMEWHSTALLEEGEKVLYDIIKQEIVVDAVPGAGGVYLIALLSEVCLHSELESFLKGLDKGNIVTLCWKNDEVFNPFSLGSYIELLGGVTKSVTKTEELIEYATQKYLDENRDDWFENDPIVCYLQTLRTLTRMVLEIIRKKRRGKGDKDSTGERVDAFPWEQEFCSLCWRRVRRSSEKKADHYCHKHHSSKCKDAHLRLTRALEKISAEGSNKLKRRRGDIARGYNKILMGLARRLKPSEVFIDSGDNALSHSEMKNLVESKTRWKIAAEQLLSVIKDEYADTYTKVKGTVELHDSWHDWIVSGVIKGLSDRFEKEEQQFWKENIELTRPKNWLAILHLFRRYQASTNLEKSIGKIGPNEVKVLEVIQFIEELNKQNKPLPSKSELARLTGVSWPTASKAVDRFKMSKIN